MSADSVSEPQRITPPMQKALLGGLLAFVALEYLGLGYQFPILQKLLITTLLPVSLFLIVLMKHGLSEVFQNKQVKIIALFTVLTASAMLHGLIGSYAIEPFKAQLGYLLILCVGFYALRHPGAIRTYLWFIVIIHAYAVIQNLDNFNDMARSGRIRNVGYFMGDGNDFGWSLVVVFAFTLYLIATTRSFIFRSMALGLALVILVGILGTKSRGATLALSASMLYFLLFISKRKVLGLIVVSVIAAGVWLLAPSGYFERMETLTEYEEDTSATGRLKAWGHAFEMAVDHPLLGVGAGSFNSAYGRFYKSEGDPVRWISPHSMYFKVLAEYGFTGIILFLTNIFLVFAENQRSARRLRENPGSGGIPEVLPLYLNMALTAFVVAGTFLGGVEYPHFFLMTAATLAVKFMANQHTREEHAVPADAHP